MSLLKLPLGHLLCSCPCPRTCQLFMWALAKGKSPGIAVVSWGHPEGEPGDTVSLPGPLFIPLHPASGRAEMKPTTLFVVLNCSSRGAPPQSPSSFFHTQTLTCYCQGHFPLYFLSFCSEELKGQCRHILKSARPHPVAAPEHPTARAFVVFGNCFFLLSSHRGGLIGTLADF